TCIVFCSCAHNTSLIHSDMGTVGLGGQLLATTRPATAVLTAEPLIYSDLCVNRTTLNRIPAAIRARMTAVFPARREDCQVLRTLKPCSLFIVNPFQCKYIGDVVLLHFIPRILIAGLTFSPQCHAGI